MEQTTAQLAWEGGMGNAVKKLVFIPAFSPKWLTMVESRLCPLFFRFAISSEFPLKMRQSLAQESHKTTSAVDDEAKLAKVEQMWNCHLLLK
jgi:hypothetical protein